MPSKRPVTSGPRSTAVALYDRVRHLIVSLDAAPGERLVEADLSMRVGASRAAVRHALRRLQQEGLVASERTGTMARWIVAPLSHDDMQELFVMVGALNGTAARLAARLPDDRRHALVSELRRLTGRLRRLADEPDREDVPGTQALDLDFHRTYERAAAPPELLARLDALHARRERYVRVYTSALLHARHLRDSVEEHERIVAAIEAGDADGARRAAAENFRNALARYDRIVTRQGVGTGGARGRDGSPDPVPASVPTPLPTERMP